MRETVLEVNDLNVWYRSGTGLRKRRHQVLHDVSFTLYRGEILGLVGESGSGKSTLALLLARARGGNVLRLSKKHAVRFK